MHNLQLICVVLEINFVIFVVNTTNILTIIEILESLIFLKDVWAD